MAELAALAVMIVALLAAGLLSRAAQERTLWLAVRSTADQGYRQVEEADAQVLSSYLDYDVRYAPEVCLFDENTRLGIDWGGSKTPAAMKSSTDFGVYRQELWGLSLRRTDDKLAVTGMERLGAYGYTVSGDGLLTSPTLTHGWRAWNDEAFGTGVRYADYDLQADLVRCAADRGMTLTQLQDRYGLFVVRLYYQSEGVGRFRDVWVKSADRAGEDLPLLMDQESAEETTVLSRFVDVPYGSYYHRAVNWALREGITAGKSATRFAPDDPCTRAQVMTFLWRGSGQPAAGGRLSFTDVREGTYYREAVSWAVAEGITAGTTARTFSPDQTCTRAQVMTFLWRMAGSPAPSGRSNPFSDVPGGAYYREAVLWAAEQGITSGTTAMTFSPNRPCTRAQAMAFLFRALSGK